LKLNPLGNQITSNSSLLTKKYSRWSIFDTLTGPSDKMNNKWKAMKEIPLYEKYQKEDVSPFFKGGDRIIFKDK